MDKIKHIIKEKVKKHGKKFSLFLSTGILKTLLSILLSWLLIDILHIYTLLGSTIVVVSTFFVTYFAYVTTKLIKPHFIKYAYATLGFNIAAILLIWFLVDFMKFSGAFSSALVTVVLFVLRYLFLVK